MRPLRRTIEISDGVKVELLFTPHLFTFEGVQGASFEREGLSPSSADLEDHKKMSDVFDLYADIIFAAGINAWVLDGHGTAEDYPFRRGDFHAYMFSNPVDYGKTLNFALEALTGKSVQEIAKSAAEAKRSTKAGKEKKPGKKKAYFGWIMRR